MSLEDSREDMLRTHSGESRERRESNPKSITNR